MVGMFFKKDYLQSRDFKVLHLFGITYEQYLKGALWAEIREKVLSRDSRKCLICTGDATQVHHVSYDQGTLKGKKINGLISICRTCHRRIEFFPDGRKLARIEVKKIMFRLAEMHGTIQALIDLGIKRPAPDFYHDMRVDTCFLDSQPATVNQQALSQAHSGLPQAGSPAVGTDRHDTLCLIPDQANGVSSLGVPDRPLPQVCQQLSRTPTAAVGSGQTALADATTPVSGTSRDEGSQRPGRCKQPAGSAG